MADKDGTDICCNVCGDNSKLKRCTICKCTYYCSREHQIKDWAMHKQICESMKDKSRHTGNNDSKLDKMGHNLNDVDVQRKGNCDAIQITDSNTNLEGSELHYKNEDTSEDGIPFDKRPFKTEEFQHMDVHMTEQDIAKIAVDTLTNKNFCVIDGLFTNRHINEALNDISKCTTENQFKSGKLGGGRTSGKEDEKVVNADIRKDKIMWLEGTEEEFAGITSIIRKMDSILREFNKFLDKKYYINGRTKAMVTCYPGDGSYYRRHVDNPNGDGRVITCILYLNEGWNVQEDGGFLRILPAGTDDYVDIAPFANRLLFFWCDRRNPHEVQPVFKTRHAITVWYMDEEERRQAKQESNIDEMAKVRGEFELQKLQHMQGERDNMNRKIDDAASQAIASLSLEELKAMSDVIVGQPNAEKLLANMGIASNIRIKLLEKLEEIATE